MCINKNRQLLLELPILKMGFKNNYVTMLSALLFIIFSFYENGCYRNQITNTKY